MLRAAEECPERCRPLRSVRPGAPRIPWPAIQHRACWHAGGKLVESLRWHRDAQREERLAAGALWEDNDLVFAQANGRPIERKSDWQAWKAILRDAGVCEVRLHDGRHTAATLLLSEGVHPRVVMEVLGHAQLRTTTATYSHVMPALGRDAADRMGRTLWD